MQAVIRLDGQGKGKAREQEAALIGVGVTEKVRAEPGLQGWQELASGQEGQGGSRAKGCAFIRQISAPPQVLSRRHCSPWAGFSDSRKV